MKPYVYFTLCIRKIEFEFLIITNKQLYKA